MEPKRHAKPTSYDELYPGRFIKAADLKGKHVTVTIADVDLEDLEGEDGNAKTKCIISFRGAQKKLVACKTNGLCLREMFGVKLAQWVGKRVTLFESEWNGEPCIRVWGSPDLPSNLDALISLPRRRPFRMTLHAVGLGAQGSVPAAAGPDDPAGL